MRVRTNRRVLRILLIGSLLFAHAADAGTCTQMPRMIDAWWPGDGHTDDLLEQHPITGTLGTPGFVDAVVGQGFALFGSDAYIVPDRYELIDLDQTTSIVGWIRVDAPTTTGESVVVDKRKLIGAVPRGFVFSVRTSPLTETGTIVFQLTVGDGTATWLVRSRPVAIGVYHYVAAEFDTRAKRIRMRVDGAVHGTTDISDAGLFIGNGSFTNDVDLYIGHPSVEFSAGNDPMIGVVDELVWALATYDRCLIASTIAAGAAGMCKGDTDGDGVNDFADNCPRLANADQIDADRDGAGDSCDCAPASLYGARVPDDVEGLRLGTDDLKQRLSWCLDQDSGPSYYDLVRGSFNELPVQGAPSETCLASAIWWDEWVVDAEPEPGQGYWYLIRAANECDVGDYGSDSQGNLRTGDVIASCPVTTEELCSVTGGVWDPVSCGHYDCGGRPDCTGIIPGCDCGSRSNFRNGVGCDVDPACH